MEWYWWLIIYFTGAVLFGRFLERFVDKDNPYTVLMAVLWPTTIWVFALDFAIKGKIK